MVQMHDTYSMLYRTPTSVHRSPFADHARGTAAKVQKASLWDRAQMRVTNSSRVSFSDM